MCYNLGILHCGCLRLGSHAMSQFDIERAAAVFSPCNPQWRQKAELACLVGRPMACLERMRHPSVSSAQRVFAPVGEESVVLDGKIHPIRAKPDSSMDSARSRVRHRSAVSQLHGDARLCAAAEPPGFTDFWWRIASRHVVEMRGQLLWM